MVSAKYDLKKELRHLYLPGSAAFDDVVVPPARYLAVDGHGDPNTSTEYAAAVGSLYASAYTLKFGFRASSGADFVVGPLEGLWSSADPADFAAGKKDAWDWTMLIAVPQIVPDEDVEPALIAAAAKKPALPIDRVRLLRLDEGRCLQILHIGSYDDEAPTLARLHHELMPALGVDFNGPHHEIYLSDPRRVAPERLKTVLRQPIRPR